MRGKKLLSLFIFMIGIFFIGSVGIKADGDSFTINIDPTDKDRKINEETFGLNPIIKSGNDTLGTHYRKTTAGKIVYCAEAYESYIFDHTNYLIDSTSSVSYNCTNNSGLTDNVALGYLLHNGFDSKIKSKYTLDGKITKGNYYDADYFVTQIGVWYLSGTLKGKNSNSDTNYNFHDPFEVKSNELTGNYNNNNNIITTKVAEAINDAKGASTSGAFNLSLKANSSNMKVEGDYYVSDQITVSGDYIDDKVSLSITGATGASIIDANSNSVTTEISVGNKVYIKIPKSSITSNSASITLKANAKSTITTGFTISKCTLIKEGNLIGGDEESNVYQNVLIYEKGTPKETSKELSFRINKTKVLISKQDIKQDINGTNEIEGAKLVIKKGTTTIDSWTSDKKAHSIYLDAGTYTLEETLAPDGYIKQTEKITFKVTDDGQVTIDGKKQSDNTIIIKNTPIKIKVSKIVLSGNKEVALSGAKFKIAAADDLTINRLEKLGIVEDIEWTSGSSPKEIHLPIGKYELIETYVPAGYVSPYENNKIKFTVGVNNNGKITIEIDNKVKETNEIKIENKPFYVYVSKQSITGAKKVAGAIKVAGAKLKLSFIELTEFINEDNKDLFTQAEKKKIEEDFAKIKQALEAGKDLDGNELEWITTAKDTKFHLPAGRYKLEEIEAPKGYELSEEVLEFTVYADGTMKMNTETVEDNLLVYTNTPEPEQVPTGNFLIYIVVIGTMAAGLATYYVMKKREV